MSREEVEYEILKVFASKINFEFESYDDLWHKFGSTFHCTRDFFWEILSDFEKADYIGVSLNGNFTPTPKARKAYLNHHIGIYKETQKELRDKEKSDLELNALKFTNSRTFKILTMGGMLFGIIGGIFGIAAYYKKDSYSITEDQIITKEILKTKIDSTMSEIKYEIDESKIQLLDSIKSDKIFIRKK